VLVPLDAAQPERLPAVRPQFVVAGHPDQLGESLPEGAERPLDVGRELPDVAGDDEPVGGGRRAEPGYEIPVLAESDMQVADREQPRLCPLDVTLPLDWWAAWQPCQLSSTRP